MKVDGIPYGYNPTSSKFIRYTDNRHLVTFGPTRSGKGATTIIQALLQVQHSVICIDPKGQNAVITARRRRELGQEVHFLNPFNELGLGTSRYNPLSHLRINQPNVVADVASLSEALIAGDDKDSHWTNSARGLIRALLLHLIEKHPGAATLTEMRRLLTLPFRSAGGDLDFLTVMTVMHTSKIPFIAQPAGRFMGDSREVQSIISTAITQTDFLDDPQIAHVLGGGDFSMLDLKEKPTTVFLIMPGRYMEAYSHFFRLLITSAIDRLTEKPGGMPTLFILDEFATMQNLAAVSKAFGFAAGYHVQLWPFLQDLPQLKNIYGDRWESFLANAGLVQFFTPADMTTAEYIQRRGGEMTITKASQSHGEISQKQAEDGYTGVTASYSEEMVPLLPIEIVMGMSPEMQVVFFGGLHSPSTATRLPYWKIDRLQGLYDPDPFHVKAVAQPPRPQRFVRPQ